MQSAIVKTTKPHVFVHPVLKQILHQIKVAFEFHQFARTPKHVLKATCALVESATYLALTQVLALLESDATTMFVQKFAIQTITAYLERFVPRVFVFQVAIQKLIVLIPKYVCNRNASAAKDLLHHLMDAVILMSVQKNFVIHQQFAKIFPDPINVSVLITPLETLTEELVVANQVNAIKMMTVPTTYHA